MEAAAEHKGQSTHWGRERNSTGWSQFNLVKLRSDEENAGSLAEADQTPTPMKHLSLSDVPIIDLRTLLHRKAREMIDYSRSFADTPPSICCANAS